MREILVIPDAHATPWVSNDRFEALGRFVLSLKPEVIVCLGDWADMPSLSRYDVGSVHAEGRRYADDIACANDALDRFSTPIREYNERRANNKKKKYTPDMYMLIGNHEERIIRAANQDPKMHGHITLDDLHFEEHGFKVIPFLQPLVLDNIVFKHYFPSGVLMRATGGDNHAASLVKKNLCSCVCGHSHMRDYWETVDAKGQQMFGLVAGCFYDHTDHYTTEGRKFWQGLTLLRKTGNVWNPLFIGYEEVVTDEYNVFV